MTCNHCSTVSAASASAAGAPDIEATWAANRAHGQQCPQCGQFMSPKGGHVCPPPLSMADVGLRLENIRAVRDDLNEVYEEAHYTRGGESPPLSARSMSRLAAAIDALERVPALVAAAYQAGREAVPPPPPALDTEPMKWRRPAWTTQRHDQETLLKITDDELETLRREDAECEAHNKAEKARRGKQRQQARKLLTAIYGKDSRQLKYFDREEPPYGPYFRFNDFERQVKNARAEAEAKIKAKQQEMEKQKLTQEAANWLLERGRKLGADFAYKDALETANEIALYEEVARREEAGKAGEWYEFDGQNCDGDCAGWDGYSHRCQCGNRRVSWQMGYAHSFKNPVVYAEAY